MNQNNTCDNRKYSQDIKITKSFSRKEALFETRDNNLVIFMSYEHFLLLQILF